MRIYTITVKVTDAGAARADQIIAACATSVQPQTFGEHLMAKTNSLVNSICQLGTHEVTVKERTT